MQQGRKVKGNGTYGVGIEMLVFVERASFSYRALRSENTPRMMKRRREEGSDGLSKDN